MAGSGRHSSKTDASFCKETIVGGKILALSNSRDPLRCSESSSPDVTVQVVQLIWKKINIYI